MCIPTPASDQETKLALRLLVMSRLQPFANMEVDKVPAATADAADDDIEIVAVIGKKSAVASTTE